MDMAKLMTVARRFHEDDVGAAMVVYSILIGIIAAASIATIALIGAWVGNQFSGLCGKMAGHGIAAASGASGTSC
jgi:pilus assembly protein Flp/PilA